MLRKPESELGPWRTSVGPQLLAECGGPRQPAAGAAASTDFHGKPAE